MRVRCACRIATGAPTSSRSGAISVADLPACLDLRVTSAADARIQTVSPHAGGKHVATSERSPTVAHNGRSRRPEDAELEHPGALVIKGIQQVDAQPRY